jgi:hypothetical protein
MEGYMMKKENLSARQEAMRARTSLKQAAPVVITGFKFCGGCQQAKPVGEFGWRSDSKSSVRKSRCKECCVKAGVAHHKANPEKSRAAHRRWAEKNPDKIHAKSLSRRNNLVVFRSTLQREYNITLEEYLIQALAQQGLCAICHQLPVDDEKLCVDHDHETGEFRGLLCRTCNAALGLFKEDPCRLRLAANYLEGR